jgi:hypothetical protein
MDRRGNILKETPFLLSFIFCLQTVPLKGHLSHYFVDCILPMQAMGYGVELIRTTAIKVFASSNIFPLGMGPKSYRNLIIWLRIIQKEYNLKFSYSNHSVY